MMRLPWTQRQDQVLAHEPVLQIFGQRRQRLQHVRRHGRQRHLLRVLAIDLERHLSRLRRVFLDDRLVLFGVGPGHHRRPYQPAEHRLGCGRENVAALRRRARRADLGRERLFGLRDLRRIVGLLQWRAVLREIFSQLVVGVAPSLKCGDEPCVGVHVAALGRLLQRRSAAPAAQTTSRPQTDKSRRHRGTAASS